MSDATAQLEKATALIESFKPGAIRQAAMTIIELALKKGGLWPDEFPVDTIPEANRNCIGIAWRRLDLAGIMKRTYDNPRASTAPNARGRTIFFYVITNHALARVLLQRNAPDVHYAGQQLDLLASVTLDPMEGRK